MGMNFLPGSRGQMRPARKQRGFSLVEVAMALGIFAFAMVGLVGLLPIGISSFHKSKVAAAQANILSQRLNEVNQTPFSALVDTSAAPKITKLRFYSEEGVDLGAPGGEKQADALQASDYPAEAVYASSVSINQSLSVPTTLGQGATTDSVLKAIVMITDISSPGRASKFPALISNLGK